MNIGNTIEVPGISELNLARNAPKVRNATKVRNVAPKNVATNREITEYQEFES